MKEHYSQNLQFKFITSLKLPKGFVLNFWVFQPSCSLWFPWLLYAAAPAAPFSRSPIWGGPTDWSSLVQPNLFSTCTAPAADSAAQTVTGSGHQEALHAGTGYVGNIITAWKWSDGSKVQNFWNPWQWVCVSEAVRSECCFPLELNPFSSLTVCCA